MKREQRNRLNALKKAEHILNSGRVIPSADWGQRNIPPYCRELTLVPPVRRVVGDTVYKYPLSAYPSLNIDKEAWAAVERLHKARPRIRKVVVLYDGEGLRSELSTGAQASDTYSADGTWKSPTVTSQPLGNDGLRPGPEYLRNLLSLG